MQKLRAGLYGINGHQLAHALEHHDLAEVVACAAFPPENVPASAKAYAGLDELLADPEVDFVSLCSPRRRDQAQDAIRALRAGKHVYAEKPCAMTEPELDEIVRVSEETGRVFREMAGTAFAQPYLAMREVVRSGQIGEVVQVVAEKSYPYFEGRAQDEDLDGGLIGQNSIHALRFVEHVACTPIASITAADTTFGNPVAGGGLRMAGALLARLKNGGLASITGNYLNPRGTGIWGYESLRILGTLGIVESHRGGQITRLVVGDQDLGALPVEQPQYSGLDHFLQLLASGTAMPLSLEEELSPTRWTIRAKQCLIPSL